MRGTANSPRFRPGSTRFRPTRRCLGGRSSPMTLERQCWLQLSRQQQLPTLFQRRRPAPKHDDLGVMAAAFRNNCKERMQWMNIKHDVEGVHKKSQSESRRSLTTKASVYPTNCQCPLFLNVALEKHCQRFQFTTQPDHIFQFSSIKLRTLQCRSVRGARDK